MKHSTNISHKTWVEISRSTIAHNVREFRTITSPSTALMAVIKSNACGHGFLEVARIAEGCGGRTCLKAGDD